MFGGDPKQQCTYQIKGDKIEYNHRRITKGCICEVLRIHTVDSVPSDIKLVRGTSRAVTIERPLYRTNACSIRQCFGEQS